MMFGLFLVFASGFSAGHVARSHFFAGHPRPLRSAWVVALVGGSVGAGLDIFTKIWVALGFVSYQQVHELLYVCGIVATYVAMSMYIAIATYYRRWIPLTVRTLKRRRR